MIPKIYFFGNEITPFPQDYTETIFYTFLRKAKNENQIVLHRKDNLLHYGYVRRLSQGNYLGICVVIDRIYKDVKKMFDVFDDVYASMVEGGEIIKVGKNKNIDWVIPRFTDETVAINEYSRGIINKLEISDSNTLDLPPTNFATSISDWCEISIEETQSDEIIDTTTRYVNIYIARKQAEIERVTNFHNIVKKKENEINKLNIDITDLSKKLTKAKNRQRNTTWVSILLIIVFVFGVILWNKVLFPSEVTKAQMDDFIYYGPVSDNMPHGTGVAIYPQDDNDGRKCYYGNFSYGERDDAAALLFYKNGNFFYGTMKGDDWVEGTVYMSSKNSTFKGSFKNNEPYNGTWYEHKVAYEMEGGKIKGK